MRNYLDEFIFSLESRSEKRISDILEDAKTEKSQLSSLVDKLSSSVFSSHIVLSEQEPGTSINSTQIGLDFRDADLSMHLMYETSNLAALILASNTDILTSDISVLEKELSALEKAIDNYAFLLSDAKAYDYAYLETFSDERGRDFPSFVLPDRGDQVFSSDENAAVHTSEGILSIPQNLRVSYPVKATVFNTNCSTYVASDTGIDNLLNEAVNSGWRRSISSPTPINATLKEFIGFHAKDTFPGALIVLEFILDKSSPSDTIHVVPFSDVAFELTQAVIYPDISESNPIQLLNRPHKLEGEMNLYFPLQSVAKFKLFLRQSTYRRSGSIVSNNEQEYRRLIQDGLRGNQDRFRFEKAFVQRMTILLQALNKGEISIQLQGLPKSAFSAEQGALTLENLLVDMNRKRGSNPQWNNSSTATQAMVRFLRDILFKENVYVFGDSPKIQEKSDDITPMPVPVVDAGADLRVIPIHTLDGATKVSNVDINKPYTYEYNIGLRSVAIGAGVEGFKGVFVSTQLPAPGDSGEVRIKTSEENYNLVGSGRESTQVTSVEYSVTTVSRPIKEEDWVPILPINTTNIVAERFFPDSIGKGYLRFPATLEGSLILYKNGFSIVIDPNHMLILSSDSQTVIGLKLPQGEYTSQDIFTCDYVPAVDNTIVNFEKAGFAQAPLILAFDEEGAGEGFGGTNGQLAISLNREPYIDYSKVSSSTYSSSIGLSPYQPITIRLSDGTLAFNLTNYKGGVQAALNPDSQDYQFTHTSNTIVFNKVIDQLFRVYYQYLPSNIRVRVVLRVNDKNFVSPKVDYYQLKAKTRKADAKNNM